MKSLLAVLCLVVFSCSHLHHEPEWSIHAGQQEGLGVTGAGPHVFGSEDYKNFGASIGGRFVGPTRMSEIDREIARTARGGNIGVMIGGAERLAALNADVAKARAAATGLREQLTHLESDLSDSARDHAKEVRDLEASMATVQRDHADTKRAHEATQRALTASRSEVSSLKVELADAEDWSLTVSQFTKDWGPWMTGFFLICLTIVGVAFVRRPRKKKK